MRQTILFSLLLGVVSSTLWMGCKTLFVDKSRVKTQKGNDDLFTSEVKPILDRRCSVCHSCFTAPCQFKTTSFAGVDRGMSRYAIFWKLNASRYSAPLTRLFVDQKTTEEWQQTKPDHWKWKLFSPVRENGIMQQVIQARRFAKSAIPNRFPRSERSRMCPTTPEGVKKYLDRPDIFGMPYNLPALSEDEYEVLDRWFAAGAPGPKVDLEKSKHKHAQYVLSSWRTLLNRRDIQSRIASRYIYEHFFIAHIQFDALTDEDYRLVRSRTPWPQPVDEIATERPTDDPGSDYYYRFRKVKETIAEKNHIFVRFNDAVMARYKRQFYEVEWPTKNLVFPSWDPKIASNPFKTFSMIPVRSRYQFMLDHAFYMINGFTRGPVCTGQVASNAVRDHFWVMFVDPNADVAVNTDLLDKQVVLDSLDMPAQQANNRTINFYPFRRKLNTFTHQHAKHLARLRKSTADQLPRSWGIDDIWQGQGTNRSALLTVNRHFYSANVAYGHLGQFPRSVWLIDYTLIERLWYSLVGGFSVYGNAFHKLVTRRYFNTLRVESEDMFFSLLPKEKRLPLRQNLYKKFLGRLKMQLAYPFRFDGFKTPILFDRSDLSETRQLMQQFWRRLPTSVMSDTDVDVKETGVRSFEKISEIASERDLKEALAKVSRRQGSFITHLHDVSFVKIERENAADIGVTLLRHEEHHFLNWTFFEGNARDPNGDGIDFRRGYVGTYPNYFYVVKWRELPDFLNKLQLVTLKNVGRFRAQFGVDRMDSRFWKVSDFFNTDTKRVKGRAAGLFDLSRYQFKRNIHRPQHLTLSQAQTQRNIAIDLGLDEHIRDANAYIEEMALQQANEQDQVQSYNDRR